MSPKRVQRKRGVPMPEGAVYVGRGSPWGNPNRIVRNSRTRPGLVVERFGHEHETKPGEARGVAVRLFREDLSQGRLPVDEDDVVENLRGRDLACWCELDQPCHADVLLEIANAATDDRLECDACAEGRHASCTDDGRYSSARVCECARSTHGPDGIGVT